MALRVLLSLLLLFCLPLRAAELLLYTEEGPPLNFTRDGHLTGYAVELVQALQKRTGDQVRIELVPWSRGYALARDKANVGLFSMARIAEREGLFQWVGPFMLSHNRFYTRKGSSLRIESLDQAKGLRIALPRQWYTLQYLNAQGFRDIFTVSSALDMASLFSKGRTDVLIVSDISLPMLLAEVGMSPEDVEGQFSFLQHQSYLGFSLTTDPELVVRWQAALDDMKRDGSFGRIYQRWFSHLPMHESLMQTQPSSHE